MPVAYCSLCGANHKASDIEICANNQLQRDDLSGIITRRSSAKMAKSATRDDSDGITASIQAMSLEEQERVTLAEIEEMEREERVALLMEKKDILEKRRADRRNRETGIPHGDVEIQDGGPSFAPKTSTGVAVSGHSAYGTARARRHSRSRRCHRTPSGSRSRSSSAERRRRSKWSLKRFTISSKEVKKLNAYELLGAAISWCLDIPDLTTKDYHALLEHLRFIAIRAMHDDFKDSAHVEYDTAVRKAAETWGFAAFSSAHNGMSVIHYGAQNMRTKKPVTTVGGGRRTGGHTQDGKRSCFIWNKEGGCPKSEESCGFGHWCSKCGSKSHKRARCSKD